MKKQNRQKIQRLLEDLKSGAPDLHAAEELIDDLLYIEKESRDNLEEKFSETERYQIISDNCDALDEALAMIDADDPDCVESVIEALLQIDGI